MSKKPKRGAATLADMVADAQDIVGQWCNISERYKVQFVPETDGVMLDIYDSENNFVAQWNIDEVFEMLRFLCMFEPDIFALVVQARGQIPKG